VLLISLHGSVDSSRFAPWSNHPHLDVPGPGWLGGATNTAAQRADHIVDGRGCKVCGLQYCRGRVISTRVHDNNPSLPTIAGCWRQAATRIVLTTRSTCPLESYCVPQLTTRYMLWAKSDILLDGATFALAISLGHSNYDNDNDNNLGTPSKSNSHHEQCIGRYHVSIGHHYTTSK